MIFDPIKPTTVIITNKFNDFQNPLNFKIDLS